MAEDSAVIALRRDLLAMLHARYQVESSSIDDKKEQDKQYDINPEHKRDAVITWMQSEKEQLWVRDLLEDKMFIASGIKILVGFLAEGAEPKSPIVGRQDRSDFGVKIYWDTQEKNEVISTSQLAAARHLLMGPLRVSRQCAVSTYAALLRKSRNMFKAYDENRDQSDNCISMCIERYMLDLKSVLHCKHRIANIA